MSMTISLPDSFDEWLRSRVAKGNYASVSDYVCELISRDQIAGDDEQSWLADLDASIGRGLEDSHAGRVFEAEAVFDELEARYSALTVAVPDR